MNTVFIILLSLLVLFINHHVIAQDLRIAPRMNAPNFTANAVYDDKFIKVSSTDFLGSKWMILLFYPFDFTFVCPTEIISFSEQNEEFEKINAQILAISTDSHHTHLTWTRTSRQDGGVGRLNFPLVADISKRISKSYGVLVEDEFDDMFGAALRGLFIISPKGIIRSIQV
jgi:peroxiredoxin (alkyl hydroperoxide reductase subunit C)